MASEDFYDYPFEIWGHCPETHAAKNSTHEESMALAITCACGKRLQVKESLAGKRIRCPACQEPLTVPAADDADQTEPEPTPVKSSAKPARAPRRLDPDEDEQPRRKKPAPAEAKQKETNSNEKEQDESKVYSRYCVRPSHRA